MAELRAEFDDPIKAKRAQAAVEALGAPSLSIRSSSQSQGGSTTTVAVGDGKQGGLLNALTGLFGGGKASAGVGKQMSLGPSKSTGKSWSFGSDLPADDGVLHQRYEGGVHRTAMTVTIDEAFVEPARAALSASGATSVS